MENAPCIQADSSRRNLSCGAVTGVCFAREATAGEAPELPLLEQSRGAGSTSDVDFWTGKDVREVVNSHLNYVVADTKQWEQSAAYLIDTHPRVEAFVKNAGLGFGIPYFNNGEPHEFIPDFVIRFKDRENFHLILETKGYDKLRDIKESAAKRWCAAVNHHGGFGTWEFKMVDGPASSRLRSPIGSRNWEMARSARHNRYQSSRQACN